MAQWSYDVLSNHQNHACYTKNHLVSSVFKSVECLWVKNQSFWEKPHGVCYEPRWGTTRGSSLHFQEASGSGSQEEFNRSGTGKTAQWCTTIWDTSRMSLEQLLPVVVDGPARSSALLDWMFAYKDLLEDKNVNSSCRDCERIEAKDWRRRSDQIKTWTSEKQISTQSGNF